MDKVKQIEIWMRDWLDDFFDRKYELTTGITSGIGTDGKDGGTLHTIIVDPSGFRNRLSFPNLDLTQDKVDASLEMLFHKDEEGNDSISETQRLHYNREAIIEDILKERLRHLKECPWDVSFDDKNTLNDWVTYIARYAGQAAFAGKDCDKTERYWLIQAAAICLAALEAGDRNSGFPERHYDKKN